MLRVKKNLLQLKVVSLTRCDNTVDNEEIDDDDNEEAEEEEEDGDNDDYDDDISRGLRVVSVGSSG